MKPLRRCRVRSALAQLVGRQPAHVRGTAEPRAGLLSSCPILASAVIGLIGCKSNDDGATHATSNMYGIVDDSPALPPAPPVDPVAQAAAYDVISASLSTPDGCLFKCLDYCVRDKDFIEPLISAVLDKYYGGVVPTSGASLTEVSASVASRYRDALYEPAGLRRVEPLIAARFAHPVVDDRGSVVTVDYGVVPGTLTVGPRGSIGVSASPHLEGGEWRTSEIGAALQHYVSAYPHARSVRLAITIPSRIRSSVWVYDYRAADDRILLITGDSPNRGLATPTAIGRSFEAFVTGAVSLHSHDLVHVRLSNFPE